MESDTTITLPAEPYRGIKPFRYIDRFIFSAREWEKKQLLSLILLYRASLLFGESGIGKSSLVNAGLVPLLVENDMQPEIIRVYPDKEETFRVYRIEKSETRGDYLSSIFTEFADLSEGEESISISLADFRKRIGEQTYSGATGGELSAAPLPVLIFDQFEELITLFEETGKISLSDGDLPVDERLAFQLEIIDFFRDCYYDPNLRVKFLFSFREDYLAKFSRLLKAVPELKDHSLRIRAIDKEDIGEIIACPFEHEESKMAYQHGFSPAEIAFYKDKLLDFFEDRSAVLTDIQIVCQYIFEQEPAKRDGLFRDDRGEFDDPVGYIIRSFYAHLLEELPDDKPLAVAILSLLVLNEHTRNIFHTDAIVQELKGQFESADVLRVLNMLDVNTRLIKSEIRPGSNKAYYEINSESLIPYINGLKTEREKQLNDLRLARELEDARIRARLLNDEKELAVRQSGRFKKWLIGIISLLLLGALILAYIEIKRAETNKSRVYLASAKQAGNPPRNQNPTLGYIIAHIAGRKYDSDEKLAQYAQFQQNLHHLINKILYYPENVIGAFFAGNNTVGVIDKSSINYLNENGLLKKQRFFEHIIYADLKSGYLINDVSNSLFSLNDSLLNTNQLCDFNGNILSVFYSNQNTKVFAIAPDGQHFLMDYLVYKKGALVPYERIVLPSIAKGISTAIFTNDGKNIIVGCSDGIVGIYDLNGKQIAIFKAIGFNSDITAMALANGSNYLIMGGKDEILCSLKLNLDSIRNQTTPKTRLISGIPCAFLETPGNSGKISQVMVSPDNRTFLCAADNRGLLRSVTGSPLDELDGHKEGIVSVCFSRDGEQYLTCSANGVIYIWGKKAANDYEMSPFSPLDYRLADFDEFSMEDIYKHNITAGDMLSNILNYTASIPKRNYNLLDKDLQDNLKGALSELSGFYAKIFFPGNLNKLDRNNKKLLFKTYAAFKEDSINIWKNNPSDTKSQLQIDFSKMALQAKSLLIDTANLQDAILYTYRFKVSGRIFASDLLKNDYRDAITALDEGINLGEAFIRKFPADSAIKKQTAYCYGELSWVSILAKDFKTANAAAVKGIAFGKTFDWIITNLALSDLLRGEFSKAETLYKSYRNRIEGNGLETFKHAFLMDLDQMIRMGIISSKDQAMNNEVTKIRSIIAAAD